MATFVVLEHPVSTFFTPLTNPPLNNPDNFTNYISRIHFVLQVFFLLPTVGSLVDNRAYFALNPGGTSCLKQTLVPLAAYSSRTAYIFFMLATNVFEQTTGFCLVLKFDL